MYFMFALLDCFLKRYIQHNKECKHHIKGKNEIFFAKSSKFSEVQTGHSHTYPLHFKLMPTTSLSHILHNVETRDHTFDYIFHSQLKKVLLNFSDYLIGNFSQSVVTCHVRLCIVINHSLSLYYCREQKPTFQIIYNWWLKYKFFLISSKYSYSCKQKGQKTTLLFSCGIITTDLFITTDFL